MKYCCCFLFSLVLHCALYLNCYRRVCELKRNLRILLRRKADRLAQIDGNELYILLDSVQLKPNISFEIRLGTRNFGMIRWKKLRDISVLALKRIFDFIVCYLSSIYFWWLFHSCEYTTIFHVFCNQTYHVQLHTVQRKLFPPALEAHFFILTFSTHQMVQTLCSSTCSRFIVFPQQMESFLNKPKVAPKVQPVDTANDTSTILDVITVQVSPIFVDIVSCIRVVMDLTGYMKFHTDLISLNI